MEVMAPTIGFFQYIDDRAGLLTRHDHLLWGSTQLEHPPMIMAQSLT